MNITPPIRMTLRKYIRPFITITVAALSLSSVQAASTDNFKGAIGVAPAVSDVGTLRTITVNATWPDACPPIFDAAGMEPGINPTTLILRFNVPATLVACAQVETPFNAVVSFTPSRDGDFTVAAVTNDERVIAMGRMLTLPANAPGSANLSGLWLGSNATSILMLTHSEGASDTLVGTWNMFAHDGSARWQFIHSSRRTSASTFDAMLSDFSVPVNNEACGNVACPVRGLIGRDAGALKVTIERDAVLTIEVLSTATSHAQLPVGTALFKASLTRLNM